jgi:hypothetical protein
METKAGAYRLRSTTGCRIISSATPAVFMRARGLRFDFGKGPSQKRTPALFVSSRWLQQLTCLQELNSNEQFQRVAHRLVILRCTVDLALWRVTKK